MSLVTLKASIITKMLALNVTKNSFIVQSCKRESQ